MKTTKKIVKARSKKMAIATPPKEELEYEKDFVKWTKTQASLLKKRNLNRLDIDNLIEEIESLGKSDKRALESHLIILLQHKLKLEYQPKTQIYAYYLNSWNSSVNDSSREIFLLVKDSPSLKTELRKVFNEAYEYARKKASQESELPESTFPKECPWVLKDIFPDLNKKYW